MNHNASDLERRNSRRFRFSLGSLLLWVAVLSLAISLGLKYRRLDRAERQLGAMQPIAPQVVARAIEQQTTTAKLQTKVEDVRNSKKDDAYKVSISWPDSTGTKWSTDVRLQADGYGAYFGRITSGAFLQAIGSTTTEYGVAVETPSPLESK